MADDTTPPERDPLTLALSVLSADERARFREGVTALVQAVDAATVTPGFVPRDPANAVRELARHYRSVSDPVWMAWSATAARADELFTTH
ncbi:hypothetical protein [Streptomyces sp. NPDC059063]|uniref:hypothetical protein n=1 Tax=unclassified Streptomyces TaxID=2593676 RepID=UPI003678FB43